MLAQASITFAAFRRTSSSRLASSASASDHNSSTWASGTGPVGASFLMTEMEATCCATKDISRYIIFQMGKPSNQLLSNHARKPQAFKPGDEWHPGAEPVPAGAAEVVSGIIWLWPGTRPDVIPSIGFNIIWSGSPSIERRFCGAKSPSASSNWCTRPVG